MRRMNGQCRPPPRSNPMPNRLQIPRHRSRWVCALVVVLIIVAGLMSRAYHLPVLAPFGKYPGDVLWAQMVYALAACVWPRASIVRLVGISAGAAYAVEFSQLIQTDGLNALRATVLGHLVLGSRFAMEDLAAYTLGIAVCAGVEARR